MSVTTRAQSTITGSDQEFLAAVDSWLDAHRSEFLADLLDWVSIPSVSDENHAAPGAPFGPNVARMLDRVRERATELGFESSSHEGYAISILGDPARSLNEDGASTGSTSRARDTQHTGNPTTTSPQPEIGLVSHLDVVPAGDGWTLDPYAPFERDGFVVGRGSSDNKGPAVGDLYLLRLFRDLDIPLRHRLRVIYGGSEESGMADLSYYAEHGPVPGFSLVTDGPFPVNFAQRVG